MRTGEHPHVTCYRPFILPMEWNILGERDELARTGPRMVRPIGVMSAVQSCSSGYAGDTGTNLIGVVRDNEGLPTMSTERWTLGVETYSHSIWLTWVRCHKNEQDP
ncbi:hypothetical protein CY34DRAFT_440958 [Suillus luteus UH-Slu-Lm8-n1]|uniref:Uncharacterized protein n=1 Tax=Suillus luteus UH-Slu-Lm8-n1 TaxID=930992 RepID=A0A0D0A846_9AGAM|nr:hypothetical protein CY34DRAFT_440958 [Suillus luteus UH-Slu-Lm8-n1]